MVQIITVTGVTAAINTPITLTQYVPGVPPRLRGLVAAKLLTRRSYAAGAPHSHAGLAHSHATVTHSHPGVAHSHAGVAHSHTALTVARSNVAFSTVRALMLSAGSVVTSGAHGAFPLTAPSTQNVGPATARVTTIAPLTVAVTQGSGVNGAFGPVFGVSEATLVVDSNGRVVNTATHPAANHAVIKEAAHGVPQIELGNAIRPGDILIITGILAGETGGIF